MVQLTAPANAAADVKIYPHLTWGGNTDRIFGDGFDGTTLPPLTAPPTDALSYTVEVATDSGFSDSIATATVTTPEWPATTALDTNTEYFWRVTPHNDCGDGQTSATFSFTTGVPGTCPAGTTKTTLFEDDMESGVNGWTVDGTGGIAWARITAPGGTGLRTKVLGVKKNTRPAIAD